MAAVATTTRRPGGLSARLPDVVLDMSGLRVALVAAQLAMILQTWRLWDARALPPNLPVWSWLPQFDTRPVLLASLVLVLVQPHVGVLVHAGVVVVALALDQMRLQPEFVSVAILLVATGPWRLAPTLGRAHLASLWLWAGFAKATSLGFSSTIAPFVARQLGVPGLRSVVAWAVPATEVGLGIGAIMPATRRWVGLAAFAFHVAAVFVLRMQLSWAIMPWNLALAWASLHLFFFAPRSARAAGAAREPLFDGDRRRTALLLAVFAYPALVYVGMLDLYLGHHVYSDDGSGAVVCEADGHCSTYSLDISAAAVGAIIPGERRVLEQWFELECKRGQTLRITGRTFRPPLDHAYGTSPTTVACRTA